MYLFKIRLKHRLSLLEFLKKLIKFSKVEEQICLHVKGVLEVRFFFSLFELMKNTIYDKSFYLKICEVCRIF